ncbi:MAG: NAD(P)H-dependent oxidoreductase [Arcobacter sp.]|nr:MAG: NAD(P)H-dependent oxidoreductase [Arcobacter sp.]
MEKTFEEAMDFRHACKVFDKNKKICDEDIHYILEAGRKSPSSFGMEPWKFLVITNEQLKEKLRPYCWNQPQVTTCSHLFIILAAIDGVKPSSGIPRKKFLRRNLDAEQTNAYLLRYGKYVEEVLGNDENIYNWTSLQTYLAAANMMTAAAVKAIDSCAIGGFEKEKVEEVLNLDTSKYQLSLVLPFGYRVNPQSPQLREKLENIVEFIK